jgi:hypothetical protein
VYNPSKNHSRGASPVLSTISTNIPLRDGKLAKKIPSNAPTTYEKQHIEEIHRKERMSQAITITKE